METGNRMLYALVIALATTVANGGLFVVHRLDRDTSPRKHWPKRAQNPRLPIDQRAIAIETQRFEVGESQLSNSFRCVQARAPVCPTA